MTPAFNIVAYYDKIYSQTGFCPDIRFIPFEEGILSAEIGWVQRANVPRSILAKELTNELISPF